MFISVLIGFLAGGAVASLAFALYGNPRADQLESSLDRSGDKIAALRLEVKSMVDRNDRLQSQLAKSLAALMEWEDWGRQMPGDRSLSTATYTTSGITT